MSRDLLLFLLSPLNCPFWKSTCRLLAVSLLLIVQAKGLTAAEPSPSPTIPPLEEPLVDIRKLDPSIVVELRYATKRNITGQRLYPKKMPALVRASVAERLMRAQAFLQTRGFRLKIWDAYRPPQVQTMLWQFAPDDSFVADPRVGRGSLHSWGVAVDATLVDAEGRDIVMPTDFDEFRHTASMYHKNSDPLRRFHLRMLQAAMARGGFLGLRTEWWHFTAKNWAEFGPVHVPVDLPRVKLTPVNRVRGPAKSIPRTYAPQLSTTHRR